MTAIRSFLFVLLVMTGLNACTQQAAETGEVRIALAQQVMTLDPRFSTDAASHRVQ